MIMTPDVPTGPWRVVVGVSGSIAAYKAPFVVRRLRQAGHEVRVVATDAALRFIGAPALAAVAGRPVSSGIFDDPAAVEHVAVGEWADLVVVAPASADLLARVASGRADDLLTATILTTTAPVVLAPAMHTQMWANPATRENVATLQRRGLSIIHPDSGRLTGADSGEGRLPDPERIVAEALAVLADRRARRAGASGSEALSGRHVVVSAGGTREPIDPVRYVGNRSSGRQGVAAACAAAERGARVTLVAANVADDVLAVLATLPREVEVVAVGTAVELHDAVRRAARDADAVIMAAAVADYRPVEVSASKIKKHGLQRGSAADGSARLTIELVENPDILASLVADPPRRDGERMLTVGFAAETGDAEGDVLAHGAAKARRKGADLLAVNAVGERLGFGDVPNSIVILDNRGYEVARVEGSKIDVARVLIDLVASRLSD
ncbi:bifunctional phosphopantothenoylcysteine decarboxylase/phosphopantothenate--cysteine ligase CoaBC [Actinomyces massiliensis]|uniref:Coenzyme A biosynthesis bifunctional protein CoaBC n=1 Tax=Actinomyces massiliensis F0489 TaxID=1125718 RepID=J1HIF0_9ACTO|nr:bifunctional phosphopantothenoylcysteine decarboxylase/phosphopantothenate--cysteine ligase CoaBC [Actinomyces massiliensis]EJF45313.1 phosphopantothenoylcysteine decarboxylase/phosphopantothenate--cysteine ligase [Actinomyces massiliensis F0489]WLD70577.1 bifunctional phosphopantothenoylcysteine decarboxylase/phosphopantothenate--cysteine ligase CoaBC [Actinomyces massiliensis]